MSRMQALDGYRRFNGITDVVTTGEGIESQVMQNSMRLRDHVDL
jgi:hypothetical protein